MPSSIGKDMATISKNIIPHVNKENPLSNIRGFFIDIIGIDNLFWYIRIINLLSYARV